MHRAHAIEMKMNQQFLATEKSLCNLKTIQVMCMFSCWLLLQTGWKYRFVYFAFLSIEDRISNDLIEDRISNDLKPGRWKGHKGVGENAFFEKKIFNFFFIYMFSVHHIGLSMEASIHI